MSTERLYVAEQAFEDWLEQIEHRPPWKQCNVGLPWNPGGTVNYSYI